MHPKQEDSLNRHVTMTNYQLPILLHYPSYSQLEAERGTCAYTKPGQKGGCCPHKSTTECFPQ